MLESVLSNDPNDLTKCAPLDNARLNRKRSTFYNKPACSLHFSGRHPFHQLTEIRLCSSHNDFLDASYPDHLSDFPKHHNRMPHHALLQLLPTNAPAHLELSVSLPGRWKPDRCPLQFGHSIPTHYPVRSGIKITL